MLENLVEKMPGGKYCCICKNMYKKDPQISLHHFPVDKDKCKQWLDLVCSRHFLDDNVRNLPSLALGKKFCSPAKKDPRKERMRMRVERSVCAQLEDIVNRSVAGIDTSGLSSQNDHEDTPIEEPLGEPPDSENPVALKAKVEYLRAECKYLKKQSCTSEEHLRRFSVENIRHDGLVRFYTGFVSYEVLLAFFEFLGPVVENLEYWGSATTSTRKRRHILTPLNQLFLMLVRCGTKKCM